MGNSSAYVSATVGSRSIEKTVLLMSASSHMFRGNSDACVSATFESITIKKTVLLTSFHFIVFNGKRSDYVSITDRGISPVVDKEMNKFVDREQVTVETMSIDDLLLQISDELLLPSITAVELTKIRLGESLNFGDVQERDLYSASLPRISSHDKGKGILVEDEPVRGNPAREVVELI
ncbi:hypothetical protein F511_43587 [Dorcoceras hygrometricum]|uniref:Uncharacterized protein n=1 Tax=Dorcoceras hygrometricum TaxID=472368 RepID=A0A2Z7CYI0_9LAMI|nr:hypothetical protein F511_43587 [Dorcoceras hygrometricum]